MLTFIIILSLLIWFVIRLKAMKSKHDYPYHYNEKRGLPGDTKIPLFDTWDIISIVMLLLATIASISRCPYL